MWRANICNPHCRGEAGATGGHRHVPPIAREHHRIIRGRVLALPLRPDQHGGPGSRLGDAPSLATANVPFRQSQASGVLLSLLATGWPSRTIASENRAGVSHPVSSEDQVVSSCASGAGPPALIDSGCGSRSCGANRSSWTSPPANASPGTSGCLCRSTPGTGTP